MTRIQIGNGRWFDEDTATQYEESSTFNGHNFISDATGDQWEHQALYHTRSGTWILHSWSQWQGSRETYEVVSAHDAAAWLRSQGHEGAAELAEPGSVARAEV